MQEVRLKPRILIVDDEAAIRVALERTLRRTFEVVTSGTIAEARDRIEADGHFDAILCDFRLGAATAQDFHRELVARDPRLGAIVAIMSGVGAEDAGEFGRAMADRWLPKPARIPELVEMLQRVTSTSMAPPASGFHLVREAGRPPPPAAPMNRAG